MWHQERSKLSGPNRDQEVEQGGHLSSVADGDANLRSQVEPCRQQVAFGKGLRGVPWALPPPPGRHTAVLNSAISPDGQGPSSPFFSRPASITPSPTGWCQPSSDPLPRPVSFLPEATQKRSHHGIEAARAALGKPGQGEALIAHPWMARFSRCQQIPSYAHFSHKQ